MMYSDAHTCERDVLTCDFEKVGASLLDHASTVEWRRNATPIDPSLLSSI